MKLGELAQTLFDSSCIKVKSARDGRMLIHRYSQSRHEKFNELTISRAYLTLTLNDRITDIDATASAVLVCFADDEEYCRLKEAQA